MKAKRILAALISAALVICALPISAAATAYVTVGGVYLEYSGSVIYATTDSNGEVITLGATEDNYNIKFDSNTLTLRNANIAGKLDSDNNYGIDVSGSPLTIELLGSNKVTAGISPSGVSAGVYMSGTTLTINGTGSLTAIGGESSLGKSGGIYGESNCNISIGGSCSVTAKGGKASISYGVYNHPGDSTGITIGKDATLIARGGDATNSSDISCGINAYSVTSGGKVLAVGGKTFLTNTSNGLYLKNSLSISGGTVIAYTLGNGGALSARQLSFTSDYYWRTSASGNYTLSSTTAYNNSTDKYVEFTYQFASATVRVRAGYGGSIASDTFAVTADSGYVIDQLWIDGAERFDASGLKATRRISRQQKAYSQPSRIR